MKKTSGICVMVLASCVVLSSCVSKKKYREATAANMALNAENTTLKGKLDKATTNINDLENQVTLLSAYYTDANNKLDLSEDQIKEQQENLRNLRKMIYAQQRSTKELQKKIADALVNFDAEELSVYMKNGKVYVSLQENLLFPSGSAVVNKDGKAALAKLATILNQNNDINVDIEGHTDDKPINTAKYPDNWALSTGRSNAIARVLIDEYNVSPGRITASGHSKYAPVATNDTEQGRAKNRRTEIVLEPKLDELMNLLYDIPGPRK